MSNGLGFNQYAARYMSKVTDAAGTAIGISLQQTFENLARDLFAVFLSKPVAVWPFYGGNADSHAINLFGDDLITWSGTITHNANGITGNGVNGFASTDIRPYLAVPDQTKWCMGVYSRTNTAVASSYEMGAYTLGNAIAITCRNAVPQSSFIVGGGNTMTNNPGTGSGLFVINRNHVADVHAYRNGVFLTSDVVAVSTLSVGFINLCAVSNLGWSAKNLAFAFFGSSIGVPTPQVTLFNIIQAYQTVLARQV